MNKQGGKTQKGKEIAGISRSGITRPSLNFMAILNDFGIALDTSCPDKLCRQLHSGVYLKPNKLKFFVEEKVNKNCFMLFPRELYVCHSQYPQYWQWIKDKDTSGEDIEVAKLLLVGWLDIKGNIQTIDLSPATLYEIVFVVKLVAGHSMTSLNLTLNPQYSKEMTRSENLQGKPLESWFEILVGEFMTSREYAGNMEFRLEQLGAEDKNGLVVKCAIIRPKK